MYFVNKLESQSAFPPAQQAASQLISRNRTKFGENPLESVEIYLEIAPKSLVKSLEIAGGIAPYRTMSYAMSYALVPAP